MLFQKQAQLLSASENAWGGGEKSFLIWDQSF